MFKRKGVWWTCIRHNGRKIQKSLETPSEKLARNIEGKIRADLVEGKFFERELGRDRNFRGMMKKFMEEHSPKVTVNMQKSYTNSLKHLMAFFGNLNLNELTKERLSDYKAKRLMDGIAPASLNRELGMIGKALNLAVDWNWLKEAPKGQKGKIG